MSNLHIVPRKGRNLSTDEQQELYFSCSAVKGSSKPTEEELSASDVEKVGVHYTPDKEIMQSLRDTPRKLVGKPAKKQAEAVEEAQTI